MFRCQEAKLVPFSCFTSVLVAKYNSFVVQINYGKQSNMFLSRWRPSLLSNGDAVDDATMTPSRIKTLKISHKNLYLCNLMAAASAGCHQ